MRPLVSVFSALAVFVVGCSSGSVTADVVEVPSQYPTVAEAIRQAPDGATIRLAPGRYFEQVTISRPVSIVAEPDTVEIVGDPGSTVVSVTGTTGVTIRGLTIVGGASGILVMESSGVIISGNFITGSEYRGVDVVFGSARVTGNQITPAPGPYVIGIRVANSASWPESVISGNVVDHAGGYGIAVNFASATIDGNAITGGERAGIAVNEMSRAEVLGNTVNGASRYGILIHDMSHAVVSDNLIIGAEEPIKLTYHSTAELSGNESE